MVGEDMGTLYIIVPYEGGEEYEPQRCALVGSPDGLAQQYRDTESAAVRVRRVPRRISELRQR